MTDWIKEIIEKEILRTLKYDDLELAPERSSKKISAEIERRCENLKKNITPAVSTAQVMRTIAVNEFIENELKAKLGLGENDEN